ncbi:MAG: type VI secretion system protein TssA [Chitinispirillaceae bacterium]
MTTPLAGDNPFGENIKFDTDFETVKNEIGKLTNTDWEAIESSSVRILKEKSKDIRVLAFLSLVYLRDEKWESFTDIFDGLAKLAEENYDNLFPDRPRARQMAFKWLSEQRFSDTLAEKKPTESEYEHIVRLIDALTRLKKILEEQFPESSPFPSRLLSEAQKWERTSKPKPAEPAPAATAQAQPAASTNSAGAAPGATAASVVGDPMDTPKQAQAVAKKIAQFLIDQEPHKPMGYRMLRSARWDILEKAPPAEGGKTQLAGPVAEQRNYIQNLVSNADWKTALSAAEKAFQTAANHFWLDLQRISATAAKNLGASHSAVHEAICTETALLLTRIPELSDMAFTDGSGFCDPATKDWINDEALPLLASGDASSTAASGSESLEKERTEMNALIAAGKIEQALEMLQQAIRNSGVRRDNFQRTLFISKLLFTGKRPDIAVSVLESLDEMIDRHHLDEWDPSLAVEAWSLLVQACKAAQVGKPQPIQQSLHQKQLSVLERISRIDPKSAFKISL